MKALSDFLAIILFFVIYMTTHNIIWATVAATVIGVLQAAYTWIKFKQLSFLQWVSLIIVVVFGGLTIWLDNPVYVMLKTTVVCWLSAAAVLAGQLMGKNGVKLLMGNEIKLPEAVWTKLSYAWLIFFVAMGLVNLAIAYPFTKEQVDIWAKYKMYGYLPLSLVFSVGQALYISKFILKQPKQSGE